MKRNGSVRRVRVSADGEGVVSHAGLGMLRELAQDTGLVKALNVALADTYRGPWLHAPGRVLTDVAVAVADGADAITGIAVLGDRTGVFGPVASMPTAWRVVDRVDAGHLPLVRAARAVARERAWAAGAGPDLDAELRIDFDATITIAHSEKENAAATWKRTFGFHPLLAFLDRPGDRWRGGAGRVAAQRQRRVEHRRKPSTSSIVGIPDNALTGGYAAPPVG